MRERHLSTQFRNVPLPVQNNYFLSRLRKAYWAPQDWQVSCTDTAEVVNQLINTWHRVYAEYQADLLPVGGLGDRRESTALCLERRFHWTGTAHARSADSEQLPGVARACAPEIERLFRAMNATRATYLAVDGGVESVLGAVRCIPLERLPVRVVSVERRHEDDVTSVTAPRRTLSLSRAGVERDQCEAELTRRGWSFYSETTRDLIFVRRPDATRRRRR